MDGDGTDGDMNGNTDGRQMEIEVKKIMMEIWM